MGLVLTQEFWVGVKKSLHIFHWFCIQAFAIKMHKMYPQN